MTGVSEIDRITDTTTSATSGTSARGSADGVSAGTMVALVAFLDLTGTIVAVNAAWESASTSRGGDPARTGVGQSYLRVASDPQDPQSAEITAAILAALTGDLVAPRRLRQRCESPDPARQDLFDVFVGSRYDESLRCVGASVVWSPTMPVDEPDQSPDVLPAGLAERLLLADPAEHVLIVLRTLVGVVEEVLTTAFSTPGLSAIHVAVGPRAELLGPDATDTDDGPVLRLSLTVADRVLGVLWVSRIVGARPFSAHEVQTLAAYVPTFALALQLVEARARFAVAEREQLLAQLYERVAEETFDATVLLSSQLTLVPDDAVRGQLLSVVHHLDRSVRRLRTWMFAPDGRFAPENGADRT